MVTRRAIALIGGIGLMTVSLLSRGQTPVRTHRVGLLMFGTEGASVESISAFAQAMRQFGWQEGRNIAYQAVYANGDPARLESLASSLLKQQVEVVVVTTSPSVRAAQRLTKTIPIVFTALSNVVGNGYVESLARPGGNVTGIASQFEEVLAKVVEFLHAISPGASRVAVLVNENNLSHATFWTAAQGACTALSLVAYRVVANSAAQFGDGVEEMTRLRVQAVLVSNDFLFLGERVKLHELLQAARLPTAYGYREHVLAGGLLSYGSSFVAGFEQAATYVDRILRGAKPADLPVEQPTKFELVLNLKTASALGLSIPQSLLVSADELIR